VEFSLLERFLFDQRWHGHPRCAFLWLRLATVAHIRVRSIAMPTTRRYREHAPPGYARSSFAAHKKIFEDVIRSLLAAGLSVRRINPNKLVSSPAPAAFWPKMIASMPG
jgi:hypothetical protein